MLVAILVMESCKAAVCRSNQVENDFGDIKSKVATCGSGLESKGVR